MLTTRSHRSANRAAAVLAVCLPLLGCDGDLAKSLEFGKPVPNARIVVELERSYTKEEISLQFQELSESAGLMPDLESSAARLQDGRHLFFGAFDNPRGGRDWYRVAFSTERRVEKPSQFEFIYYNDSTDGFGPGDWVDFFRWHERLERHFSGATLVVTKHPAVGTRTSDIETIALETGFPIPEKYRP